MRRVALLVLVMTALIAALAIPPELAGAAAGLDEGIQELTQQVVPQVQKLGKKRLAVVDFADLNGRVSDLGRFIAEELSANLALADGGLRVVDRQHLSKIIAEQKLSVVGVTEPGTVQKLGQLAGADVLLAGSVTPLDDRIRITAKVLSTATADIVGAAMTTVPIDATVQSLQGGSPSASVSPVTPAGRPLIPLADLRFVSAAPDGYHFVYVTKPLTIAGRVLRGGLLVFPSNGQTRIAYDLEGRYREFSAIVGLPEPTPPSVRAVFRIYADGTLVYPGRVVRAGDGAVAVRVAVEGARTLTLQVDADGVPTTGHDVTYALWGEPRLVGP